jgi:hypothetical protein
MPIVARRVDINHLLIEILDKKIKIDNKEFDLYYSYIMEANNDKLFHYYLKNNEIHMDFNLNKNLGLLLKKIEEFKKMFPIINGNNVVKEIKVINNKDDICDILLERNKIIVKFKDYGTLTIKSNPKILLKVLNKIIEEKLFYKNIILHFIDIRNEILSCLENKKYDSENIRYAVIMTNDDKRTIKVDNEEINISLWDYIRIDNREGNKIYEISTSIRGNSWTISLNHLLSLDHFLQLFDYIMDRLEHLYRENIFFNKLEFLYTISHNNKKYVINYRKDYNIIVEEYSTGEMISILRFENLSQLPQTINMIKKIFNNENLITNLIDEHKKFIYNFVFNRFNEIISKLEISLEEAK